MIIDKVIDVLATFTDIEHTLCDEFCGLHTNVFSYGYGVHAKLGVKGSDDTSASLKSMMSSNSQQMKNLRHWFHDQTCLMSQLYKRDHDTGTRPTHSLA